jgi:hypothetical protein
MIGAIKKIFGSGTERPVQNPNRNDPCWCGSGEKYKRCCIDKDRTNDRVQADACRRSG